MKSLLAMAAASAALLSGALALVPTPAAAMDGQDETSPCTEETDWYYDDVGEDCADEGGGGGGSGGGEPAGGDDHYYDETGDPCADYGECWDEGEDTGRDDPLYDESPDPCPESVECWDDQKQDELERKRIEERDRELKELERDFAEDPQRVAEELLRRIEAEREAIIDALNEIVSRCQWWFSQGDKSIEEGENEEYARCWTERGNIAKVSRVEIERLDRERKGSARNAFPGGRKPTPVFRRSRRVSVGSNGASIRPLPLAPLNGRGKKQNRGRPAHRPT